MDSQPALVRHYLRRIADGVDKEEEEGDAEVDGYINGIKASWKEVQRVLARR